MSTSNDIIGKGLFINSLPKAGTNLVSRLLGLSGWQASGPALMSPNLKNPLQLLNYLSWHVWSGRGGVPVGIDTPGVVQEKYVDRKLSAIKDREYLTGHVGRTEVFESLLAKHNIPMLLVVRDPRDVVVSHAHYIVTNSRHPLHQHYNSLENFQSQLLLSINGGNTPKSYLQSIGSRLKAIDDWRGSNNCLVVRFEDLVGSGGGGTEDKQREVISEMGVFLGLRHSPNDIDVIVANLFGGSKNFRKGQIGSWTDSLSNEQIAIVNNSCRKYIEAWGYS